MLKISSLHPQSLPLWEQVPLGNIWTQLLCPGPASPIYGHLPPSSCGAPGSPCTLPPLHRSDSLSPPAPPSPGPWLPSANLFVKRCSKLFFFFFFCSRGCTACSPPGRGRMQGVGCRDPGCRDLGCKVRDVKTGMWDAGMDVRTGMQRSEMWDAGIRMWDAGSRTWANSAQLLTVP